MKSAKESCGSIQQKLSTFLFRYRTTPHSLTNETPAKLLYGRSLRTRLDLIKPSLYNTVSSGQEKMKLSIQSNVREFTEGQRVMTRDYRSAERKLIPAEIQSRTGPLSYTVDMGLGTTWRRHADQLRSGTSDTNVEPVIDIPEVVVPTATHTDAIPPTVLKSPVVSEKLSKPSTSVPTPMARRYPQRERRAPRSLICEYYF